MIILIENDLKLTPSHKHSIHMSRTFHSPSISRETLKFLSLCHQCEWSKGIRCVWDIKWHSALQHKKESIYTLNPKACYDAI